MTVVFALGFLDQFEVLVAKLSHFVHQSLLVLNLGRIQGGVVALGGGLLEAVVEMGSSALEAKICRCFNL